MQTTNKAITLVGALIILVLVCILALPGLGSAVGATSGILGNRALVVHLGGHTLVVVGRGAYKPESPANPAGQPVAYHPTDNYREAWAIDLLSRLGNTRPTQQIVDFIVSWTLAEDSGTGAFERFNPLNTTQSGFNETATINSDGVRGYATYEAGLDATVQTLSYGYYTEIVAGLVTNDPQRAFLGLINSPWAASHYNGGAGWPIVTR